MSNLVTTLVVLIIGCVVVLLAVPVAQAFVSSHILSKGLETLDKNDKPREALEELGKLENWTSLFPSVAVRIQAARARCYYRLGDVEMAYADADRAFNSPKVRPAPAAPTSAAAARRFFVDASRWVASRVINKNLAKTRGRYEPLSAYHGLLYEAELTEDETKMRECAAETLAKNETDRHAKDLLAYLDTPERKKRALKRVRTSAGTFATKKRTLSKEEVREGKRRKLLAQLKDVDERIEKYKTYMTGTKAVAPPDQEAYDKANAEYQRAVGESKALHSKWQNAEGAERARYMQQLQPYKGRIAILKDKRDSAAAKIGGASSIRKNDPQLRKLEAERREIQNQLDML